MKKIRILFLILAIALAACGTPATEAAPSGPIQGPQLPSCVPEGYMKLDSESGFELRLNDEVLGEMYWENGELTVFSGGTIASTKVPDGEYHLTIQLWEEETLVAEGSLDTVVCRGEFYFLPPTIIPSKPI